MKDLEKFVKDLISVLNEIPPDSHLPYIQHRLREIEDPAQRIIAENILQIGIQVGFNSQQNKQIIVLIHGIRTFAEWFDVIKNEIEHNSDTEVHFIRYGYLDALRFWFPLGTRARAIRRVKQQLRAIRDDHRTDDFIIVAHSFGTYIISKILETEPDIEIKRLLLCGSIIQENYRWDLIPKRPKPIVNDCGIRDPWPIAAKILSWGYGSSGSFGLNSTHITNRYFDTNHSGFFNNEFIKKYWIPFIVEEVIEPSTLTSTRPKPSWLKAFISILPIQWIVTAILAAFVLLSLKYDF